MDIILLILSIILSIVLISKGSDWLTDSLVPIARKLKTSNISVGLILVSVVVSLPEILVAGSAAFAGYTSISLGVAFGSIICNIGLMTGLSAMIRPLHVTRNMILRDGIISIVIPILVFAISQDGQITRFEGFAMFLLFIPYLTNVFLQEKTIGKRGQIEDKREVTKELDLIDFGFGKLEAGWLSFVAGLILLLFGTNFFAGQLISLTTIFSLNPLFVGLTLGAIVPSIPNIVASFKATTKGLTEVAVSETIGSNVFTLLVTVGIISMISPSVLESQWLTFDIPIMLVMSLLLVFFMMTGRSISKLEGAILLGSYLVSLYLQVILFMR